MDDANNSYYALTNASFLPGEQSCSHPEDTAIVIEAKRIAQLCPVSQLPENCPRIDLQGSFVAPGYIDLQLNGCGGVLFNSDISAATLDRMHETNLQSGCTTFLPTLITSDDESIVKAVDVVREYAGQYPERVPGLHLEGPYLNPVRKGIHDPNYIRPPSADMIDYLCQQAGVIKMVTLAPEVCPPGTIEKLSRAGIIVSIGHTDASCAQVKEAGQAGARFVTHLFNAMNPVTGREPGVIGAVFDSEHLAAGIIADGFHVAWENIRTASKLLQDRLILVTDATPAAGSSITEFDFAGQKIKHKDGQCIGPDGTLGGSSLTMDRAVLNCVQQGITRETAIRMATVNAANAIGLPEEMGSLQPGCYANLTLLDNHLAVTGTVRGGSLTFNRKTLPEQKAIPGQ